MRHLRGFFLFGASGAGVTLQLATVTFAEFSTRLLWLLTPRVLAGPITSLPLTCHAGRASQLWIAFVHCPHGVAVLFVRLFFVAATATPHVARLAHSVPVAADPLRAGVALPTLRFLASGAAFGHAVLAQSLAVRQVPLVLGEFVYSVPSVAL